MTSTYDDSVLDFDLNFLNQNSNGTTITETADHAKYEKQKRNMSIMKKKIVSTDSLIAKYYSKKQMLYEAEKNLAATKEECKQICIDYRNALEKCNNLETERQTVQNAYKNVEERCSTLENQCEAFQSHIHQLQQLLKEKDSTLDSLRGEKKKTINMKEFDKKVSLLERDKTSLNNDVLLFADLIKKVLGKRKLKAKYNELLRKYEQHGDGNISDSSDIFEEPFSPPLADIHATKKTSNVATDSECDYSIDTGRGSSVASDNEKFILSPEYFINDCPTALVTIEDRAKIKVTNVATSPIIFEETVEVASLPLIDTELDTSETVSSDTKSQLTMVDRCLSPIRINNTRSVSTSPVKSAPVFLIEIQNEFESKDASTITDIQTLSQSTIDRSISPINMTSSVSVFTSPMKSVTKEIATSPLIFNENIIQNESTQDVHEKECLELNNSNNLRSDNHADYEIEMILNTMQMNHDIITPIPRTPSRTRISESRNVLSHHNRIIVNPKIFDGGDIVENNNEKSELEELKMELDNMKTILKQHILLTSKKLQFNHEPLLSKLVTDNDNLNAIHSMDVNENTLSESLLDGSGIQLESNLEVSQPSLFASPIDNDLLFGPSEITMERDADNVLDDNTRRTSLPRLQDENLLQNLGQKETTTEVNIETLKEISLDANDSRNPESCEELNEESAIKVKTMKRKRLSKLDKLKKTLKPNYKIRSQTPLIVRSKLKSQPRNLVRKKITNNISASRNDTSISLNDTSVSLNDTSASLNDTSASLNDKHVYEKAVKIMAELKSKQSSKTRKTLRETAKKSVDLASNEKQDNRNETTKGLEETQSSEVTSKSKTGAIFEKRKTPLDDNITKVVTSKPQICSKEVGSPEKPTKPNRKKSLIPLSALFEEHPDSEDEQTSSELVMNTKERCKSPNSSKATKDSVPPSKTSPSSILNRNSESGNKKSPQTPPQKSPQTSPQKSPQAPPQRSPQTSPQKSPQTPPQRSPQTSPQKSPQTPPQRSPRTSPQTPPQRSPQTFPPTSPQTPPQASPQTSPPTSPQTSPQKPPQTTPKLNSKQLFKAKTSPLKPNKMSLLSKDTQNGQDVSSGENCKQTSPKSQIATRSKNMYVEPCFVVLTKDPILLSARVAKKSECQEDKVENSVPSPQASRKRRHISSNEPEIQCKRILRSSTACQRLSTENKEQSNATCSDNNTSMDNQSDNELKMNEINNESPTKQKSTNHDTIISYDDLDLFSDDVQSDTVFCQEKQPPKNSYSFHPKQSILCCMLDKYGVENVRKFATRIPDTTVKTVSEKIEQYISNITESSPAESKNLMNRLVADMQKLNHKLFMAALMKYLTKPTRKMELFSKVVSPPAPPMTKAEQILIYVILNLKTNWPSVDIVDAILTNIEYTVFKLNRTPEFGVVESISHFYALLCRYFGAKSRLRLFILDAMYCIQFKSVPLIKQCLDVWMHIIPLAHMGIAKCPLVTCLVYLLHFYKCNDRFNRVQEIRNILSQKYFYQITDWDENKILEMFKNSIMELKDVPIDRKMLRIALIILAKRQGPRWCQNKIIKNLLLPMIEKQNLPDNVKEFCVSMIGPLMKPYPADMKVHCEIVMNQLTDMLNKEPSQAMEEAIITSMIFINRHNHMSINKTLLSRKMKPLSSELEGILREYVRAMPLKVWKKNISQLVYNSKFN